MAVAFELSFNGHDATIEKYFAAIQIMGTVPGGKHPDPQCLFHWVRDTGGGFQVTDVWTSAEAFQHFAETKIGPVSDQVGLPRPAPPRPTPIEVVNFLTAGA